MTKWTRGLGHFSLDGWPLYISELLGNKKEEAKAARGQQLSVGRMRGWHKSKRLRIKKPTKRGLEKKARRAIWWPPVIFRPCPQAQKLPPYVCVLARLIRRHPKATAAVQQPVQPPKAFTAKSISKDYLQWEAATVEGTFSLVTKRSGGELRANKLSETGNDQKFPWHWGLSSGDGCHCSPHFASKMRPEVAVVFMFASSFCTAEGLSCHYCGGADAIPSFAKNAINSLNLSTNVDLFGDCKANSGSNVCSDGLFCIKRAVIYEIGFQGISFKWNTYTKGCANKRVDNDGIATNTCYDLGKSSNTTGYSVRRRDCYCQKPDLCNSAQTFRNFHEMMAFRGFRLVCLRSVLTTQLVYSQMIE
ncbi:unnamed protein product [Caenorhabditis auriculariae]|uniref:Uncharacterized protein n=1 Tax=Caenorhabditis auriculariae TaxID=2777116 RepID=A0A8S1HC77_9PELO|nr:unnamed protein product [Caenorhabditis auriculariae]